MTPNFAYLSLTQGRLKLLTIFLAASIMCLSFSSYFLSGYIKDRPKHRPELSGKEIRIMWREVFLLVTSTLCFIASCTNLFLHCRSLEIYYNRSTAIFDFLYHSLAALLLASSGMLFIVSSVKMYDINCLSENGCQYFSLKLGTGGLAMISAVIFGACGTMVLTLRKDIEREKLVPTEKRLEDTMT